LSLAELDEKVGEIGIEDAELFAGQVLIARTDDGDPVIMLMGPEDFQVGETMEFGAEEFTDLRQQLSEAGFEDVRQDHAWQVLQGRLDGHYVLATSGDPSWGFDAAERDTGMTEARDDLAQQSIGEPQTGDTAAGIDTAPDMTQPQTGDTTAGIDSQLGIDGTAERGLGTAESGVDTQPGVDVVGSDADQVTRALGGDFDRDHFGQKLDDAGIEDRAEFQGKLVRARTEDGQSLRLLIGPEGFAGDEEVELSEDELREKLEDAGLSDVQVVEDNVAMIRGSYNGHSVLILGGMGITDDPMRMGAAQTGQDIDVTDIERPQ
jgi:hypothetical protein